MTTRSHASVPNLAALRQRVRALERGSVETPAASLGADALDTALPGGGLARAAVHEIAPASPAWDDGPATGFTLALLGRLLAQTARPALWVTCQPDLYAPALPAFGVDPARLLIAQARNTTDALWTMETALRSPALVAVTGELRQLDRTAGRRLQLAAETGGTTGLVLLRRNGPPHNRAAPSTAATRWRIGARPSAPDEESRGPGGPRWRVELRRCRGGRPADFLVEWNDATGDFALATPLRDGAAALDGPGDRLRQTS